MAGGKRNSNYWGKRRSKQFSRFAGKSAAAFTAPSTAGIAKAAWSGVKYLRTLVNSEVHKADVGVTTTTINSTGTITLLNGLAQGDTALNRTGNSVMATYLSLKCAVLGNAVATQTIVRLIIFIDKQQIADTVPAITDILSTSSPLSFYNNAMAGRFEVLDDKMLQFDVLTNRSYVYKFYKKFGASTHVKYNGVNATDIQKNGMYFLILGTEGTNTSQIVWNSRFAYHDN
jgi:hypothetical protein